MPSGAAWQTACSWPQTRHIETRFKRSLRLLSRPSRRLLELYYPVPHLLWHRWHELRSALKQAQKYSAAIFLLLATSSAFCAALMLRSEHASSGLTSPSWRTFHTADIPIKLLQLAFLGSPPNHVSNRLQVSAQCF